MQGLIKPLVFVLSLWPAAYLFYAVYLAYTGGENLLGADPAKTLSWETGSWAIRFLILSLAVTPLRYLFSWPYVFRLRRMVGLFAFFYACLHLLVFLMFLLQWEWQNIGLEIVERPYITLGFFAWLLLLPLALTSLNVMQRKLGRNWKRLHRSVYLINILAVLHVVWIIRSSYAEALLYGVLVAVLLVYRLLRRFSPAVRGFSFLS